MITNTILIITIILIIPIAMVSSKYNYGKGWSKGYSEGWEESNGEYISHSERNY